MTVGIESLVSRAQSSYGLRKANGYNQNRLYQIIGVLTANLGLDLNSYDIYIALSNGLYSDDIKLDLTIANSILSSYHKKNNILMKYFLIATNMIYILAGPIILMLGAYLLLEKFVFKKQQPIVLIIFLILGAFTGYWSLIKQVKDIK